MIGRWFSMHKREGGRIHDAQALADRLHGRQLRQALGLGIGLRIIRIDAVHLRRLQEHIAR